MADNATTTSTVGASLSPDSASRIDFRREGSDTPRRIEKTAAESVGAVTAPSRAATVQSMEKAQ
jgi:hypothetical protein